MKVETRDIDALCEKEKTLPAVCALTHLASFSPCEEKKLHRSVFCLEREDDRLYYRRKQTRIQGGSEEGTVFEAFLQRRDACASV